MKGWFGKNYRTIIISAFLIPIITVAIVSISHVTKWYGISNPVSWAVYLSIGIEIAALSALAAISADMGRKVYFPFGIVTLVQFIGNIFFAYSYIDVSTPSFTSWVELVSPLMELLGVEPTDLISHKRYLALFAGGMLPVISLSFLHMLVKFTQGVKEKELSSDEPIKEDIVEKDDKPEEVVEASEIVAEVSRLRPTEEDLSKLEELLNKFNPVKEKVHPTKEEQRETLTQMMRESEEMGLYETPEPTLEPTPTLDEQVLEIVKDQYEEREEYGVEEEAVEIPQMEREDYSEDDEDISDWDVTLMDGLDEEEWDEDHAQDLILNDILDDLTDEEIDEIINGEEYEINEPVEIDINLPVIETPEETPVPTPEPKELELVLPPTFTVEVVEIPTPTSEDGVTETPTPTETTEVLPENEEEKKNLEEFPLSPISVRDGLEKDTDSIDTTDPIYWENMETPVVDNDNSSLVRKTTSRNVGNTQRRRFR